MTCFNLTSDICIADMEKIYIWLKINTGIKITEIITCSKPRANASESCKPNDTNGPYAGETGQITGSRNRCDY